MSLPLKASEYMPKPTFSNHWQTSPTDQDSGGVWSGRKERRGKRIKQREGEENVVQSILKYPRYTN